MTDLETRIQNNTAGQVSTLTS